MNKGWIFLLAALLAAGCRRGGADPDDQAAAPAASTNYSVGHNAAGQAVVTLDAETQQRIGLKTASIEPAQLQPSLSAYGAVLDPEPLVALQGEVAAGQAALGNSKELAQRARKLYDQSQTISQKALQSAENDERMDEIKLRTAQRTLQLTWGDAITALDPEQRQALLDRLADHKCVLARVNLPLGENLGVAPSNCDLSVEGSPVTYKASILSAAPMADPKSLGQGFLLRIDSAGSELVPGAAVMARLDLPGAPLTGVSIPYSALIHTGGKTWVYLAGGSNQFTRSEVEVDAPRDNGWFATNGVVAGGQVVVQGAAILLSEEEKAQIQGGD